MYYAYIRVSTDHQNLQNQQHEILAYTCARGIQIDKWISEVISSRKSLSDRKLGKLLTTLKKGDVLIATEISRLGRNLLEVMGILQKCLEKDCQIWTLKENYRLGADIQSKVLAFAFSLASEIERRMISERTKLCLKRLKDEGLHLGRPFGSTYKKLEKHHRQIVQMLNAGFSKAEIARLMGCTWQTLQRYIKNQILS